MIEIGRLCIKTAGRDAGKRAVVIDILEENYVMLDGQVRRKRCNMTHIEPLKDAIKIKKGAPHSDVIAEFKKLGIEIIESKAKEKKEKPKKVRKKDRQAAEKEGSKEKKSKEPKKEESRKVLKEKKNPTSQKKDQ